MEETHSPEPQSEPHAETQNEPVHTLEHVDQYLHIGQESEASDVHLGVNAQPIWRRFGMLESIWLQADILTAVDTERLAMGFLNDHQKELLRDRGDVDFAYATDFGRFRASVVRHRLGIDIVFRIINTKLRTMDDLGLPDVLKMLTQYHNGLILVTGSVGSGKSTTLAAMVDHVNEQRHDHIITLEDPIEYIIPSKNCHVTQREVHTHTRSFGAALRGALREDPDVIMVGEMRDLETIQLAITASESLRGIVSQQLVPNKSGSGRVLALEILTNTPAVGAVIRDAKTFMLPGIIQTGRKNGMRLMDDSLADLYHQRLISKDEAYARADQKALMRQHFKDDDDKNDDGGLVPA